MTVKEILLATLIATTAIMAETLDERIEKASNIFNCEVDELVVVHRKYVTLPNIAKSLKSIAGVYGGTVDIVKKVVAIDGGKETQYACRGKYSSTNQRQELKKASYEADLRPDFIITQEEIDLLKSEVYEKFSKK